MKKMMCKGRCICIRLVVFRDCSGGCRPDAKGSGRQAFDLNFQVDRSGLVRAFYDDKAFPAPGLLPGALKASDAGGIAVGYSQDRSGAGYPGYNLLIGLCNRNSFCICQDKGDIAQILAVGCQFLLVCRQYYFGGGSCGDKLCVPYRRMVIYAYCI